MKNTVVAQRARGLTAWSGGHPSRSLIGQATGEGRFGLCKASAASVSTICRNTLHVLRDFYRYAANLVEVSNPAGAVRGLAVDHDLSVYLPHFAKKAACRLLA